MFEHYKELQAYVGWTDEDAMRLSSLGEILQPHLLPLIDDFYQEIERHYQAKKVITGGPAQISCLKGTLIKWISELFSGNYDASYVARRWAVGWRHVEIGLAQVYTNVALSRLRIGLLKALQKEWKGDAEELALAGQSLNRVLDLDLAIIEDAYQAEQTKRQNQIERLAAIGQVSGGIAHELRNPLNVIETSAYFLVNAKNASPAKVSEHLTRISRQVEKANGVITALSDFAKLPLHNLGELQLGELLKEALDHTNLPQNICSNIDCPEELPSARGDRQQLGIVFENLIRNARDAMPNGGDLQINVCRCDPYIEVQVIDTGTGIKEEDLKRILEPLFTTKTRGIGLGLSLSNSIIEKHGGQLKIESKLGQGSTFTVRLLQTEGGEK